MFFGRASNSDDLIISTSNTGSPQERIRFGQNGTIAIPGQLVAAALTVDTDTLFVDATNNRVGIGTTNPLARLHIADSSTSAVQLFIHNTNGATNSSAELVFGNWSGAIPTGTGNPGPQAKIVALNTNVSSASTDLIFHTYASSGTSAERMRITSGGNLIVDTSTLFVDATNNRVGIGTASPSYQFEIYSDSYNRFFATYPDSYTSRWNVGVNAYIQQDAINEEFRIAQLYGTGKITFLTSGGEKMRITSGGDVGIGMTPSYKLDVTGSARVSDAIAIGTTPDTNNPFKILKNINATVGIKFENTNTSSSAFSAVQLGTDVSGGTKFTNLVYSSSGISASGVYNPDGTSLINNGNGGLNFLGNPIRMYTGGSNGVLRWDIQNDGIRQYNADVPTTNTTDAYRQYSADVTAGNAAPHFRTENGAVIKLYQETTAVGNSIISLGGGNAVLDDTTFDGYTLRQIVKALRNQGILA